MTVRREIAEPRRETGARSPGDWLRHLRQCLSRSQNGDRQKGASPQQYVEGPSGEPACLDAAPTASRLVVAANPRLKQKCSGILRARPPGVAMLPQGEVSKKVPLSRANRQHDSFIFVGDDGVFGVDRVLGPSGTEIW